MRTKQDIWQNQCDKCGEIQKEGDLACADEDYGEWESLALCKKCFDKLDKKLKDGTGILRIRNKV